MCFQCWLSEIAILNIHEHQCLFSHFSKMYTLEAFVKGWLFSVQRLTKVCISKPARPIWFRKLHLNSIPPVYNWNSFDFMNSRIEIVAVVRSLSAREWKESRFEPTEYAWACVRGRPPPPPRPCPFYQELSFLSPHIGVYFQESQESLDSERNSESLPPFLLWGNIWAHPEGHGFKTVLFFGYQPFMSGYRAWV